jgi:hypothetical protein
MLEAQSGSNKTEIGKLNCLLRAIVFLVLALGIFAMVIVDIGDAANMFLMIAASVVLVISGVMIMIKSLRGKG